MRCVIFMFMIFLSCLAIADADGLFQYDRIDFFTGQEAQRKTAVLQEADSHPKTIESEWAEPITSPSGKVSIYLPPKEVRDFLDDPNPENAKGYLEWNLKRINKLTLSQRLLSEEALKLGYVQDTRGLTNTNAANAPGGDFKMNGNYLLYFMLKGCPACAKESKVIADISLRYPEIKIWAFGKGFSDKELMKFKFQAWQEDGLSSRFNINTYPTIVVVNKTGKKRIFSGYVGEDKILSLFE